MKWLLVLILAFSCGAAAQGQFDVDFERKDWQELQGQLPQAPRDADLYRITVDGSPRFRFYVDVRSLDVGSDGVVRYTVVAASPDGARNVSHEGLRCTTRERKVYAFGRSDGTWGKARESVWQRIEVMQAKDFRVALLRDYFCVRGDLAPSRRAIVDRVKQGPGIIDARVAR